MHGMRVGEVVGGPTHAACWARYKRSEGDAGGVATRSGEWGCMACKCARDERTRARDERTRARDERTRARSEGTVPMTWAESKRATNDSTLPTIVPNTNAPTDAADDAPAAGRGLRRRANRLRRQITRDGLITVVELHSFELRTFIFAFSSCWVSKWLIEWLGCWLRRAVVLGAAALTPRRLWCSVGLCIGIVDALALGASNSGLRAPACPSPVDATEQGRVGRWNARAARTART